MESQFYKKSIQETDSRVKHHCGKKAYDGGTNDVGHKNHEFIVFEKRYFKIEQISDEELEGRDNKPYAEQIFQVVFKGIPEHGGDSCIGKKSFEILDADKIHFT